MQRLERLEESDNVRSALRGRPAGPRPARGRDDLGGLREVVAALAAADYPEVDADNLEPNAEASGVPSGPPAAFQAPKISLGTGETLLRELHFDVARHWIVMAGSVQVTAGTSVATYEANQSFHFPPGNAHGLANKGAVPAELIEVRVWYQAGS